MIFANIEYLFLLVLLIPYIIWYVMRRQKTEPTLQVSTTRMYMKVSLAEYRNRRYRHHAGGRRFHQYAGRRFET